MQKYINKHFPYKKLKLDYGSCDYKTVESLNSIFLSNSLEKRIYRQHSEI